MKIMSKSVRLAEGQKCRGYPLVNGWEQDAGGIQNYTQPFSLPDLDVHLFSGSFVEAGGIALKSPWSCYAEGCRFIGPVKSSRRWTWIKTYLHRETISLDAPVVSLVNCRGWQDQYFHWMLDVMPVLLLASKAFARPFAAFKILVPQSPCPYIQQSLDTWKVPEHARVKVIPGQRVLCEQGLCLSGSHRFQERGPQRPHDPIHPLIPALYKEMPLPRAVSERKRRILIYRKAGAPRAFQNFNDVEKFAHEEGFELVDLEKLYFSKQALLFAEASHVIAVHGAGLSNLVFASGCRVLEIHSRLHGVRSEFFQLTSLIGGEYRFVVMDGNVADKSVMFPVEIAKAFADGA
ncbi:glycosyltransferase family 61 protein [Kiritimatiellota bacterium B12222]|nr:glycosyltransferase family 61 protein [Kiritimatiellota bacterium B12222]